MKKEINNKSTPRSVTRSISILVVSFFYSTSALANSNSFSVLDTKADDQLCLFQACACVPIPDEPKSYVKDEVILSFPKKLNRKYVNQLMQSYGLSEKNKSYLASLGKIMMVADTNGLDPLDLVEDMSNSPTTIDGATNNIYKTELAESSKNRALAGVSNYALNITGVTEAHEFSLGEGVLIGMIDTPVDTEHLSLRGKVTQEYVAQAVPRSEAYLRHGTSVAGVMVSSTAGVGIAPEAEVFAVSAFTANRDTGGYLRSTSALVARSIERTIQKKVDILNMSFAGGKDDVVAEMVARAQEVGIIVVAASGNDGKDIKTYPAALDGVIAVTAVDHNKKHYGKANRGEYIDVSAPGVGIITTAPGDLYRLSTGTSIASAHVTGAIALLMSRSRNVAGLALLTQTAADLGSNGRDTFFGYGLVDVLGAMRTLVR